MRESVLGSWRYGKSDSREAAERSRPVWPAQEGYSCHLSRIHLIAKECFEGRPVTICLRNPGICLYHEWLGRSRRNMSISWGGKDLGGS